MTTSTFKPIAAGAAILGLIWMILTLAALPVVAADQSHSIPVTPNPNGDVCWDREDRRSMPQPTFEQFIEEVVGRPNGLFLAFQPVDALEILGGGTYQVEVGDIVRFRLQLYSIDPAQTYRIFILINETPYAFNTDTETGYFQDIPLDPETSPLAETEVVTPALTEGIHDISVVVMSESDIPADYQPSFARGLRLTIVAGSPELRTLTFQNLPADPISISGNISVLSQLGITRHGAVNYWLETEVLTASEVLGFDILRGYLSHNINSDAPDLALPETDRFAIVVYINGEPIQLDEDFTIYAEVTRDTHAARIYVEIPVMLDPGIHELVAVAIPHPGIPVCTLFGPMDGYFFLMTPEYVRVTVELRE